jgi:Flp pilus assembly protein TadB
MIALAALALASALLMWPGSEIARRRLAALNEVRSTGRVRSFLMAGPCRRGLPIASLAAVVAVLIGGVGGAVAGVLISVVAGWLAARWRKRPAPRADPLRLAASWDLLAACLQAGLPVPVAVDAIADQLPGDTAEALHATAELLALGADPVRAWLPALRQPDTAALARGARRTTRSGAALAGVAMDLARRLRDTVRDAAEARAQRASVLIAGPLGLCFLPAFLCLGIVPVVVGLATGLESTR